MKLYRKKLSGVEELEREKIKLRYQQMHLEQVPLKNKIASNGTAADSGLLGTLMDLAGGENSTKTAFQIGSMLIKALGKKSRKKRNQIQAAADYAKEKSTARKVLEDVLISYLIGKALRVSVNLVRDKIKEKKPRRIYKQMSSQKGFR